MMVRKAAIDVGNDSLKGFFGAMDETLYIPNIIAEVAPNRDVVEYEKKIVDGLHVEITSEALSMGKGTFAVGNLAMKYEDNDELTPDSEKSESDQTLVLLLTALAVDATKNFKHDGDVIEATYFLSTGLPLAEAKKGKRKAFKEKLKNSQHTVRFKDTPTVAGKVVRIKFFEVLVNTEGHAAMIDLTTNNDGSIRNEELTRMTVLINDIGGLSTDAAIIMADGSVDNVNSDGINKGVSTYLDEVMEKVEREFGYNFKSRRELVEIITSENTEERNHIYLRGNRKSIQHIVDEVFEKLAREEYKLIKRMWQRVPSLRKSYQIGGGSLIIKDYLNKINEQDQQFPLAYVSPKESIWMIARAYFKLLEIYIAQKQVKLEAAPTKE